MKNIKKFTPSRSTYIVLCTLIPITPILVGIDGIYFSEQAGIWITLFGVGLIFTVAFAISRYNLVVDELYISYYSVLKKTTILRSQVTRAKYTWETGRYFSPVFCIFTSNLRQPSIKIRIKIFSKEDVREIAKILNIDNCPV